MEKLPQDQEPRPEPEPQQSYETPRLTKHGRVEDITQKLTTGSSDGISGSTML